MSCKRILSFFLLLITFSLVSAPSFAQHEEATHEAANAEGGEKKFNASEVIFGHISDSHDWHFFSIGESPVSLPLPVIIYSPEKGLSVFSSSKFGHEGHREEYNGYTLNEKNKVVAVDGSKFYDFSITKNVLSMIISVILMLWIMTSVAKKYKQGGSKVAPSGFQNALETVILFVRDEVAKPNLGEKKYLRFMPLLLTLFFFIWINNLLGLLPGGANFTGNIAVTAALALVYFVVMLFSANKHFWGHLLNPPGVPFGVKLILVPIEIIAMFIKPIALTIRLFANILAGHIIILSIISMIFIFGAISKVAGIGFAPVSIAFTIFMFFLELLVGAIQAFIFTNLTAVFLGQAVEEGHHEGHGDHGFDHAHHADELIA